MSLVYYCLGHNVHLSSRDSALHAILSTLCGVYMVQCVKLMPRIFEFGFLLSDCLVYRQNLTCLKRFARYGHYTGEVEDKKDVSDTEAY